MPACAPARAHAHTGTAHRVGPKKIARQPVYDPSTAKDYNPKQGASCRSAACMEIFNMSWALRLLGVLALLASGRELAMAVEEPRFDLIEQADSFEIRQYHEVVVAETHAEGDLDQASNRGFRTIADYIFGNNRSAQQQPAAAGQQDAPAASQKIAMTAPVTVEPEGSDRPDFSASRRWRIQFVMPAQYTLDSLPRPLNPEVNLRTVPGRRFAVCRFSGIAWEAKVRERTAALQAWTAARGLKTVGAPQLARYNPPWTLPFWRRNEILLEIEPPP